MATLGLPPIASSFPTNPKPAPIDFLPLRQVFIVIGDVLTTKSADDHTSHTL